MKRTITVVNVVKGVNVPTTLMRAYVIMARGNQISFL
jgi:hypothetical protein